MYDLQITFIQNERGFRNLLRNKGISSREAHALTETPTPFNLGFHMDQEEANQFQDAMIYNGIRCEVVRNQ